MFIVSIIIIASDDAAGSCSLEVIFGLYDIIQPLMVPTHSLTHLLTHSLTHLLTYSLTQLLRALHEDSLFWQGLYSNQNKSALNTPLLGMWEIGTDTHSVTHSLTHLLTCLLTHCYVGGATAGIVVDTIHRLETKIVPIIPFDSIEMDGSKYFSGGTHSLTGLLTHSLTTHYSLTYLLRFCEGLPR